MTENERDQVADELQLRSINMIAADLYNYLITMSWTAKEHFDEYQQAWLSIYNILKCQGFDWTKGERPVCMIGMSKEASDED